MKKVSVLMIVMAINVSVFSQKMEFFGQINSEGITPVINFATAKKFNEKIGISFFSLISRSGWAEAYFGPTFSPTPNSSFSVSAGIETGGNQFRMGSSAFIAFTPQLSFLLVTEKGHGKDNYWYHSHLMKSYDKVSVGIMARRYNGVGPRMEVTISKELSFWVAPLWDFEDGKVKGVVSLVLKY